MGFAIFSLPSFHRPVDLTLGVLLCRVLTLVIELFALGERDLDLDEASAEVDRQRDQRVAVLLDLAKQARDLALVHQEPARTKRIFVENVALLIRRNVDPYFGMELNFTL